MDLCVSDSATERAKHYFDICVTKQLPNKKYFGRRQIFAHQELKKTCVDGENERLDHGLVSAQSSCQIHMATCVLGPQKRTDDCSMGAFQEMLVRILWVARSCLRLPEPGGLI